MAEETKDIPGGDKPRDTKQTGIDQVTESSTDSGEKAKEPVQTESSGTVGADVPDKAQALPPEAGSVSPVDEVEAKTKAELPAGEKLKTEAKVESALPGVEKPSKTPTVEGASEKGEPATPEKTESAKPQSGAASVKPAPPRAAAGEKAAPPKAVPAAGHKPAEGAKPPPAKKGPTITTEITGDPFIDRIKKRFGEAITEAVATLGQQIIRVKKESYLELCRFLHDDDDALFDMCTDLTATHWPDRAGQEFDIVVLLYSVAKNRRLRVKVAIAGGETCPSITPIWAGADWMEREVFDMFGVRFDGHADLRRILLPPDWPGHPLRKDYPVEYRDNEWTDKHLQYREIDYDTSLIDVKYRERR
ncbi:MAG TPA: NADH-quinone oxidoreductase subunit C [Blastocatellia bacterium]|jgi:NADH-quinone oxidoreductase subunit C|nr:NADH-quinone oxidoreductase subunit C [Blastocatellia bacterium]